MQTTNLLITPSPDSSSWLFQIIDQHERPPIKEANWAERIEVGPVDKVQVMSESLEVPAASTLALVPVLDVDK